MPRPPLAPVLDSKTVWNSGQPYERWLESCETESRNKMSKKYAEVALNSEDAEFLKSIAKRVHLLGIAEDWCGDVIHSVPAMARLAEESPNIEFRIVERTADLIIRYLTNGAESIPKLIVLTDDWIEVGHWGPRPEVLKTVMAKARAAGNTQSAYPRIKEFYQIDRHQSTIKEIRALLEIAVS